LVVDVLVVLVVYVVDVVYGSWKGVEGILLKYFKFAKWEWAGLLENLGW